MHEDDINNTGSRSTGSEEDSAPIAALRERAASFAIPGSMENENIADDTAPDMQLQAKPGEQQKQTETNNDVSSSKCNPEATKGASFGQEQDQPTLPVIIPVIGIPIPPTVLERASMDRSVGLPGAYDVVPGEGGRSRVTLVRTHSTPSINNDSASIVASRSSSVNQDLQVNDGLAVASPVDESSALTLQTAEGLEGDHDARESVARQRKRELVATLKVLVPGLLVISLIVLLVVFLIPEKDQPANTTNYSTLAPTSIESFLYSLLPDHTIQAMEVPESAQYQAFEWLREDPSLYEQPEWRILQRYALMTFFYATSGPTKWRKNAGWGNYTLHECKWFHNSELSVKTIIQQGLPHISVGFLEAMSTGRCDENGIYQHIWLNLNGLDGSLPEELFLLTSLMTLFAVLNPNLQGTISSRVGQLSSLKGIATFNAGLSGSLPTEIDQLESLQVLALNSNGLDGSIPEKIWQLTNLELISLYNNNIQGSIPSQVGTLSRLRHMNFNACNLSGSLPTELGLAHQLIFLVFRNNAMSGTIPSEIGSLSNLLLISGVNSQLSGTIPSELGLLTASTQIAFIGNSLTGTVPSEFGLLSSLTSLTLGSNLITGPLPLALSNLSSLNKLKLDENYFTGLIPSEFGLLTSLGLLSLKNNSLHGTVPRELAALESSLFSLHLEGNPLLSGTVPEPLCAIDGKCIGNTYWICSGPYETTFDCTDLLCGCDCPCSNTTNIAP